MNEMIEIILNDYAEWIKTQPVYIGGKVGEKEVLVLRDEEMKSAIEVYLNALENERPTGEWLWLGFDDGDSRKWSCSFCGRGVVNQENFCPNCGAKMTKEAENE